MGGSYESQSYTADCERTINLYPEMLESQGATQKRVLYPTPGVEEIADASAGAGRAHFFQNGREFAVIGTTFHEIDSGGALTTRGTVALGSNPATISSNGDGGGQLFITSGDNGYIFNLTANTLTQITALNGKATMGEHMDGYFLALDAATSTFYFSDLLDGTTWTTGENFGQRSLAPDRWLSMKVLGRIIWFFGEHTSETWYDTGATFPFAPTPNSLLAYGITAPFSPAIIGDDIIWLGATKSGRKLILRAQGVTPEIISTKPLESAFETYDGIENAVGDVYSERGHTFYLISFDNDNVTWAFDTETKLWCERGTWVSSENRFVSWRPRFYASAFGEHRILDSSGGKVYRMSATLSTDVDGLPIKRVRRAPAINNELQRVFYPGFELDLEPGLGRSPTRASFTMAPVTVVAGFTWSKGVEDQVIQFTDTSTGTVDTWAWDFGDLQTSTDQNPNNNFDLSGDPDLDHVFTVTLEASGPDGSDTATATVTVNFNDAASGTGS